MSQPRPSIIHDVARIDRALVILQSLMLPETEWRTIKGKEVSNTRDLAQLAWGILVTLEREEALNPPPTTGAPQ